MEKGPVGHKVSITRLINWLPGKGNKHQNQRAVDAAEQQAARRRKIAICIGIEQRVDKSAGILMTRQKVSRLRVTAGIT